MFFHTVELFDQRHVVTDAANVTFNVDVTCFCFQDCGCSVNEFFFQISLMTLSFLFRRGSGTMSFNPLGLSYCFQFPSILHSHDLPFFFWGGGVSSFFPDDQLCCKTFRYGSVRTILLSFVMVPIFKMIRIRHLWVTQRQYLLVSKQFDGKHLPPHNQHKRARETTFTPLKEPEKQHLLPCRGQLSFHWSYSTEEGVLPSKRL